MDTPTSNKNMSATRTKKDMSALYRTQPCRSVVQGGVCYRKVCTYAHSLDELRVPECVHGSRCQFFYGRRFVRECMFKHPTETNEQYYTRTGKQQPNLPQATQAKPDQSFIIHTDGSKPSPILTWQKKSEPVEEVKTVKTTVKTAPLPIAVSEGEVPQGDVERVIKVPACMADKALEIALCQGFTNIRIETY